MLERATRAFFGKRFGTSSTGKLSAPLVLAGAYAVVTRLSCREKSKGFFKNA